MNRPLRVAHLATIDLTHRVLLLGQLRRLRDSGFDVAAVSAPGPWVSYLEHEGIRHIPWRNVTRAWDPRADARAFLELLGILRRERFDVVHTHNAKPGVMGRIAARALRVPCVVNTVHGFDARPDDRFGKRAAFMGLEWIAARFSDLELYQSGEDLDRARRARIAVPPKAAFLGNGTDLSRFDPASVRPEEIGRVRAELGIDQDALVVGTVGRLVRDKGYRELFAAARLVRSTFPSVRFLAVGDRDHAKADVITEDEISRATEDVIFTGWREDMPAVLRAMDIFVLPSYREGVPRSAIEGAAMGRALVLTDIPGCRQIVRHEVEGLLVPPRDAVRLADSISALIADAGLRERLGEAARARALERFDEQRVVARLLDGYGRLLGGRGITGRDRWNGS